MKKYLSYINFYRVLFLGAMLVAIYSCLTYGRSHIINDVATASLLAKCQLETGHFFPITWHYAHSDLWAVDLNIFSMPFLLIFKNQSLARAMGSVLVLVIFALSVKFLSKSVFDDPSYLVAIPLLLLFTVGNANWVLWEASYTLIMVYVILGVTLICRIYEEYSKKNILLLFLVLFLACLMGTRFIAELVGPASIALIFVGYEKNKNETVSNSFSFVKNVIKYGLVIGVPSILGLLSYKWVCAHTLINSAEGTSMTFTASIADCWTDFTTFIMYAFYVFGYVGGSEVFSLAGITTFISIVLCVSLMVVVPLLQIRELKNESTGVRFFSLFVIIHNIIIFVMFVFMGYNESRYILTSVFANILLSSRYVYIKYMSKKDLQAFLWTLCFCIALLLQCTSVCKMSSGWKTRLLGKEQFAQTIVDAGINKGYADTFYSGPLEVYSDFELSMGQVFFREDGIAAMEWLIDDRKYEDSGEASFILLSQMEFDSFSPYMEAYLGQDIGNYTITDCDGEQFYVYMYDYDVATRIIR